MGNRSYKRDSFEKTNAYHNRLVLEALIGGDSTDSLVRVLKKFVADGETENSEKLNASIDERLRSATEITMYEIGHTHTRSNTEQIQNIVSLIGRETTKKDHSEGSHTLVLASMLAPCLRRRVTISV